MNNTPENQYLVTWIIDIYAESPEDAAAQARKIQLDPKSVATVFDVQDQKSNVTTSIDLETAEPVLMGTEEAREDIDVDKKLSLIRCEIGFYDTKSDPHTPYKTMTVLVAVQQIKEAVNKAVKLVESKVAMTGGILLMSVAEPVEISHSELDG